MGGAVADGASGLDATGGTDAAISDASGDGMEQDAAPPEPPPCPKPSALPDGGTVPPSCSRGLTCACGLSCCERRFVPGGWFPMGRSLDLVGSDWIQGGDWWELPEHPVHVSDFYLDAFEVTVARFRQFVEQYPANLPQPGDGAHAGISDSGWRAEWNALMPATREELENDLMCDLGIVSKDINTWTDVPGQFEDYPINCVSWYEAFAFCIWDGGRLPSEAEWECAAAGGEENRRYPWGAVWDYTGGPDEDWERWLAHACIYPKCFGTTPSTWGMSRWGQFELGGSLSEWVFDPFKVYPGAPCNDCSNVWDCHDCSLTAEAGIRGSDWASFSCNCATCSCSTARSAMRHGDYRSVRAQFYGFRCARSP
jgi:formylglycine-generating enzyme